MRLALLFIPLLSFAETSIVSTNASPYQVVKDEVVISSHSHQHTAIESAANTSALCENECVVYVRRSLELRVSSTLTPSRARISWQTPRVRTNGTTLNENDISYYQIDINGDVHLVKNSSNQYIIEYGNPGSYNIRVRAVDTNGLKSEWSDVVVM